MKKTAILAAVFCSLLLLASPGCKSQGPSASSSESGEPASSAQLKIGDYFPILDNTRYVYQGEGNEYASYDVYNDYTAQDRVQQRVDNGGTVMVRVLAVTDGKLIQVYSGGEVYVRENALQKTGDQEVLLAEPIETGTTWTLKDGRVRTITGTSVTISTPCGDYDAVEVTTRDPSDSDTTTQYYARDVGLVKSVFRSGDSEISSTLSTMETDVPSVQTIRFFYPNLDENKVYYEDRAVSFRTNDSTGKVLAESYREVPAGVGKVFSAGTEVNSLAFKDDGIVYLDLNKAFVTEMNAGSGYEGMILTCVADTFGYYYNTDKVVLTIEGEPYSSGHFSFDPGEYLQADFTSAVQLQS